MRGWCRRRAVHGVVAPLLIAFVATGCWSQYRGDWGHSGAQAFETAIGVGNVGALDVAWVGRTAAPVTGPATVAGGIAYVTATDGRLYAFDAAGTVGCSGTPRTCTPLWTGAVPDQLQSRAAVVGGTVFVQGLAAVYAFDADACRGRTGCSPRWNTSIIGYADAGLTVAGDALLAVGAGGLFAFDARGSTNCGGPPTVCLPQWSSTPFAPDGDASPAVAGGTVYVSDGQWLHAFDLSGGVGCDASRRCAPLWRVPDSNTSPAVVAGTVYVAGGPQGLGAHDAAAPADCRGTPRTCAPRWTTTLSLPPATMALPPVVANGTAMIVAGGSVVAFDAAGQIGCAGTPRRCAPRFRAEAGPTTPLRLTPTVANGVLYSGTADRLQAFAADARRNCAGAPVVCAPLWSSRPVAGLTEPIVAGGSVYAGSANGLLAYRPIAPAARPGIASLTPHPVRGARRTVTVAGSGFAPGVSVATTIPGADVGSLAVLSPDRLRVDITVPPDAEPGTYSLRVTDPDGAVAVTSLGFDTTGAADLRARSGVSADPIIFFETPAEQRRDLDAIADLGGDWIAVDVIWNWIQRDGADRFDWEALDRAVLHARDRGLRTLGVVSYSPSWAVGSECPADQVAEGRCLPRDVGDYTRFLAAAVARYGATSTVTVDGRPLRGSIGVWQIWNEPNHAWFSQPKPDPAKYTGMLRASFLTVRAGDPGATVITGATAPTDTYADGTEYSPDDWTRELYVHGARDSFDAVGHHPYSFPTNPLDPQPFSGYSRTLSVYGVMVEYGDATKKIWATEMGAPTGTHIWAMSEADQAQWLHDYLVGWNTSFAAFTGPITMKSLRDLSPDPADLWANTGVLRYDWSRKPAHDVFTWIMAAGLG